jgi:ubiquinone/menaquinone biosynthesis C-methylase UbiE
VQGDAQNLPFPDQSFDAVINVEASHIYPEFERFVGEVARVLPPEGIPCTQTSATVTVSRVGGGASKAAVASRLSERHQ